MITPLCLGLLLAQVAPDAMLRRFALIAGANDGGAGRVTLRYATSDAHEVSKVLTQLGGVAEADLVLVDDPTVEELERALDQLATRVAAAHAARARTEVVFYYSGHSDEEGLLLKGKRLSYASLRGRLDGLETEIRIAVLDSCASGAMTRSKGGIARPAFLVDQSSQLTGHAFVTSASADESAQESERLKASIFTHFFLSGLRGAADASHDGRITLSEAYQYAFSETLARSTSTRAGPQRPTYDIQLVGSGDLVLTDVRTATSHLVLDAALGGRIWVLGAQGGLVVEVAKAPGKPIDLGLEAGEYRVVVDDGTHPVGEARVSLALGDAKPLSRGQLTSSALEPTVLRGGEAPERPWLPVDVALVYPIGIAGFSNPSPRVNFGLGIIAERVGAVDGAMISSVVGWVDGVATGASIGGVFSKVGGLRGLGLAGVLLLSTGDVTGLTASLLNLATRDVLGAQLGLIDVTGGEVHGAQLAVVNVAAGEVHGAQLGVGNAAGGFGGLQAGVANLSWADAWGAQLGVVNVGGDVSGAQVGVLNIASHVHGAQVGVLNIAQTSDAPVGLLNIITHGNAKLAVWTNETSVANVAFKLGGEHVYSALSLGFNPRGSSGRPFFSYGFGLGVRVRGEHLYGELEASFEDLHQVPGQGGVVWESGLFSTGLRVNVGYQLVDGVALFAGPQLHAVVSVLAAHPPASVTPWGFDVSGSVRLVPGFVVGAQFL